MLKACDWCCERPANIAYRGESVCSKCIENTHGLEDEPWPDSDPVNRPGHYAGEIECIDAIRAALGDDGLRYFCLGNAMKYIWRADKKGSRDQDMAKALWYLRMAAGDDPRKDRQ